MKQNKALTLPPLQSYFSYKVVLHFFIRIKMFSRYLDICALVNSRNFKIYDVITGLYVMGILLIHYWNNTCANTSKLYGTYF